jgi:Ca2+-binding RTX toxin-like protein
MRRSLVIATLVIGIAATASPVAYGKKLTGTPAAEAIFGTPGRDKLNSGGGDDLLFGGAGKDKLKIGPHAGGALALGGTGKDLLIGGSGTEQLVDDDGTKGDEFQAGSGDDQLFSADGAKDFVDCGKGNDIAYADGSDVVRRCETVIRRTLSEGVVFGTSGSDNLGPPGPSDNMDWFGLPSSDIITGGDGVDVVIGGTGADSIVTVASFDFIYDGDGESDNISTGTENDDIYSADGQDDVIDCGEDAGDNDEVYIFSGEAGTNANCETVVSGLGEVVPL